MNFTILILALLLGIISGLLVFVPWRILASIETKSGLPVQSRAPTDQRASSIFDKINRTCAVVTGGCTLLFFAGVGIVGLASRISGTPFTTSLLNVAQAVFGYVAGIASG